MNRRNFLKQLPITLPTLFLIKEAQPHTDLEYCKAGETLYWEYVEAYLDGNKIEHAVEANVKEGWLIINTNIYPKAPIMKKIYGKVQILFKGSAATHV
jgi:hypothetical protein